MAAAAAGGGREDGASLPDFPTLLTPSSGPLRDELRRLKFPFIEVEEQLYFAECAQGDRFREAPPHASDQLEGARHATTSGGQRHDKHASKERIKELKRSIAKQQELQELHRRDILQASQRVKQLRQQCTEDAQEMQRTAEREDLTAGAGDAAVPLGDALQALHASRGAAEEAARKAEGASQALGAEARGEMMASEKHLEWEELLQLERKRRASWDARARFQRLAAGESAQVRSLQAIQTAQARLGLPAFDVDSAQGLARLAAPDGAEVDEAVRTVRVEFGPEGELVAARPHPALRLEGEADLAVLRDDLGRLLTRAWEGLCERPELAAASRH